MNRIKRWTAALVCRMDQMLAQIENHEALAESVIGDVRRATAQAKVQLARVRNDGERLRTRLLEEREAEGRWRERARECADSDEQRAIECLKRSRRAAAAIPELQRRVEHHDLLEAQLGEDVARVEERLQHLQERRNLMRTRQSRAEAMSGARAAGSAGEGDASEVFDRWDMRITELELDGGADVEIDTLELEYTETEERQDLLSELAELRGA